ncbi:hypothetical protein B0T16DRAFT_390018 [Cercophora newfieldiana]|uniref:Uncharacterized protein n=1 Tax=Cercophora newfieldiana TaxID=92897 RepID=A0AA39Y3L4_9PEZI|nr:hypothetical protein B0T16DRAFT_390018 [Cercophora newfieldiana]
MVEVKEQANKELEESERICKHVDAQRKSELKDMRGIKRMFPGFRSVNFKKKYGLEKVYTSYWTALDWNRGAVGAWALRREMVIIRDYLCLKDRVVERSIDKVNLKVWRLGGEPAVMPKLEDSLGTSLLQVQLGNPQQLKNNNKPADGNSGEINKEHNACRRKVNPVRHEGDRHAPCAVGPNSVSAALFVANTFTSTCQTAYTAVYHYWTDNNYANLNAVLQNAIVSFAINIASTPVGNAIWNSESAQTEGPDGCSVVKQCIAAQAGNLVRFAIRMA